MNPNSESWGLVLGEVAVKGFVALALAGGVVAGWRRASAAERHRVWLLGLVACMVWPWLPALVPAREPGMAPARRETTGAERIPGADGTGLALGALEGSGGVAGVAGGGEGEPVGRRLARGWRRGCEWMAPVWGVGVVLLLARSGIGRWRLGRLRRRARPVSDARWGALLEAVSRRVGCRRRARLLESPEECTPATFGCWRPVILLPAGAREWGTERGKVVLAHELAHVRRYDCVAQAFAEGVCTLNWFNPLVWWAAHRMRVDREHACDDAVVGAGWKASEYAGHLLDLVQGLRRGPGVGALAIGHRFRISGRVAALADGDRPRREPRRGATALMVAGVLVGGGVWPRMHASPAAATAAVTGPAALDEAKRGAVEVGGGSSGMEGGAAARAGSMAGMEATLEIRQKHLAELEAEFEKMVERMGSEVSPAGGEERGKGGSTVDRILEAQAELQVRMLRTEATLAGLRRLAPKELLGVLPTLFPEDTLLKHLLVKQADAELDLAALREQSGDGHPDLRRARSVVEALEKKIEARVEGILRGLEAQREAFRAEADQYEQYRHQVRIEEGQRARVERELAVAKRRLENERIMVDVLSRRLAQERFDAAFPRGSGAEGKARDPEAR